MSTGAPVLTVSDITGQIKFLLEESFSGLSVVGEITNFKYHHGSGHMYFSLKDERSQLRIVMWRGQNQRLAFQPQDGMQVIAQGALSVYEVQGQYQMVAQCLIPAGEGALRAAFEKLKTRLAGEGLFDFARKRPLPPFPERVGVITSASGAAIRDILRILHDRAPFIDVVLRPTPVQGVGAADEIARAIEEMNRYGEVDVLIVGRGGGSMEDLWAFNEEAVVRAIAASEIPVVSAVGHEVDTTLADLAADYSAATPSNAAEKVAPDARKLYRDIEYTAERLHDIVTARIRQCRERVNALVARYGFRQPVDLVRQRAQYVDDLKQRLIDQTIQRRKDQEGRLAELAGRLEALSPLAVLQRGYALCRRMEDGRLVRDSATLRTGDRLEIRFHTGKARCRVERLNGDAAPDDRASRTAVPDAPARLSLFDEQEIDQS